MVYEEAGGKRITGIVGASAVNGSQLISYLNGSRSPDCEIYQVIVAPRSVNSSKDATSSIGTWVGVGVDDGV